MTTRIAARILSAVCAVASVAGIVPPAHAVTQIVVDAVFVERHLGELAKDEDLSRYIL